jgi:hypothetical protein
MSGLGSVVEDPAMSAGARSTPATCSTTGSATTRPGLPGYTPEGDVAGNNGNVAVSSQINTSARSHVELWMSGPFHAIGILRPTSSRPASASATWTRHRRGTAAQRSTCSAVSARHLAPAPDPVPGNGTTTNLNRFVVESPSPMTFCNWTGAAGSRSSP